MKRAVYLETSIVSYLAARPSHDLVTAARQQITHEWWERRRPEFQVYVSEAVLAAPDELMEDEMGRPLPKKRESWQDLIVREVRNAREELFANAGCDIEAYCQSLREGQQREGRRPVVLSPEPPDLESPRSPRTKGGFRQR